ncbi:MAG: hypothetical protein ACTSRX_03095 [Promethearchaeota archaeon]
MSKISISVQPETLSVCKLLDEDVIPKIPKNRFFTLSRTKEEISIVIETQYISPS